VPYSVDEPAEFEAALGASVGALLDDPARAAAMGEAGRVRAVEHFGWDMVARRTLEVYESVLR